MARIKLNVPEKFIFSTTVPVRITDVNYGGHVGNDSVLSLVHETRMQFLASFGMNEKEFWNTSLIMGDVAIEFKKEIFYGEVLEVLVNVVDIERVSFDIFYQFTTTRNGVSTIVANAKTGMVCFDYDIKKVTAVPVEAIQAFSGT